MVVSVQGALQIAIDAAGPFCVQITTYVYRGARLEAALYRWQWNGQWLIIGTKHL